MFIYSVHNIISIVVLYTLTLKVIYFCLFKREPSTCTTQDYTCIFLSMQCHQHYASFFLSQRRFMIFLFQWGASQWIISGVASSTSCFTGIVRARSYSSVVEKRHAWLGCGSCICSVSFLTTNVCFCLKYCFCMFNCYHFLITGSWFVFKACSFKVKNTK